MVTVKQLRDEEKGIIKRLLAEVDEVQDRYSIQKRECEEFGGFISAYEVQDFLKVSRERVGRLLRDGRFRMTRSGNISLGDVRLYKKHRRPGRPKKGSCSCGDRENDRNVFGETSEGEFVGTKGAAA